MKNAVRILLSICLIIMLSMPGYVFAASALSPFQTGWTRPIPDGYLKEAGKQGRVIRIKYNSRDYAGNGGSIEKTACVYLPYGYNADDTKTRYDIFYVMHGLSGTADEFFGINGGAAKNLIDNMIEKGNIHPMIIVAPTFDAENKPQEFSRADSEVRQFHLDFLNDLMPAVEGKYHTYSKGVSKKDLMDSRDHRAFGGFSMGSVTTWMQFCYNSDYIRYYLPMSGACWYYGGYGSSRPVENCDLLEKTVRDNKLNERGYFIYACTGTNDTLRGEVDLQMKEMYARKNTFTPDHVVYFMKDGGAHDYSSEMEYIYNALPLFFTEETAEAAVYKIYSNFEQKKDPSKKEAELYFYKGKKGADSRLYTGEDGKAKAIEASKQGYNAFVLKSRSGEKKAAEDRERAAAFINDNTEYLNVGKLKN
ncbi:MAG: hypothetical protein K6A90_11375 [Lachnospiraceae bacterium]|nr:hypothetical protein [Lachnospiraceae bacterium]